MNCVTFFDLSKGITLINKFVRDEIDLHVKLALKFAYERQMYFSVFGALLEGFLSSCVHE